MPIYAKILQWPLAHLGSHLLGLFIVNLLFINSLNGAHFSSATDETFRVVFGGAERAWISESSWISRLPSVVGLHTIDPIFCMVLFLAVFMLRQLASMAVRDDNLHTENEALYKALCEHGWVETVLAALNDNQFAPPASLQCTKVDDLSSETSVSIGVDEDQNKDRARQNPVRGDINMVVNDELSIGVDGVPNEETVVDTPEAPTSGPDSATVADLTSGPPVVDSEPTEGLDALNPSTDGIDSTNNADTEEVDGAEQEPIASTSQDPRGPGIWSPPVTEINGMTFIVFPGGRTRRKRYRKKPTPADTVPVPTPVEAA